jgi:Na+/proline symporter
LAYAIYRLFILDYSLVSIIGFVVIAQLALPFGAFFWKRGSKNGAITGIILGFAVCFYTLLIPPMESQINQSIYSGRTLGIEFKSHFNFWIDYLEPIPHAVF